MNESLTQLNTVSRALAEKQYNETISSLRVGRNDLVTDQWTAHVDQIV